MYTKLYHQYEPSYSRVPHIRKNTFGSRLLLTNNRLLSTNNRLLLNPLFIPESRASVLFYRNLLCYNQWQCIVSCCKAHIHILTSSDVRLENLFDNKTNSLILFFISMTSQQVQNYRPPYLIRCRFFREKATDFLLLGIVK